MQFGDHYGQVYASVSSVTASTNSSVLLYSNDNRHKALFFNHSTAACFLKFGPAASLTDFTVKIGSGSYYEMPLPVHSGSITAIWDAAVGRIQITEL